MGQTRFVVDLALETSFGPATAATRDRKAIFASHAWVISEVACVPISKYEIKCHLESGLY